MKTVFGILILFFLSISSFSQTALMEYTAGNGITYKEGDIINLNRGSAPNGDFVYLTMSGWGMMVMGPNPNDRVIGKGYAGLAVSVKKIKKYNFKGVEKVVFTVGGGNITNYMLDIEEAINTCEIKDCISPKVEQTDNDDVLSKLKKLKELLDSGAITQEEYDVLKSKIIKEF